MSLVISLIEKYMAPHIGARKMSEHEYLDDLGLDSMAKAEIIEQIERKFNIKGGLGAEATVKCKTVGDFANAVDKALAKQKNKKYSTLLYEYRNNVPYCKLTGYKCRKLADKKIVCGEDMCKTHGCKIAVNFYCLAKQVNSK